MQNTNETIIPTIGMGVTQTCGSDSYAWTIVEIVSLHKLRVQRDKPIRTDKNGWSESQDYIHVVAGEAEILTITLRSDGYWRAAGEKKCRGHYYTLGKRESYRDPSF